jgi:hypothetical protein
MKPEHNGMGKTAQACSQCTWQDTACQWQYVTSTFWLRQHGWTAKHEVRTEVSWNRGRARQSDEPWANREDALPDSRRAIKMKDTHFDNTIEDTHYWNMKGCYKTAPGLGTQVQVTYCLQGMLILYFYSSIYVLQVVYIQLHLYYSEL